ncbi:protein FAM214B [Megalops cyprinoides]|uniref:protein FAM214B n=1 Tax=Megalops cyprinoides TaxID=118141 RepID=UPI001865421D|nr:protein FAM214B [Megalops cyprinoides]
MRHIHVEIARKEAPVEHPAQDGDLPPPSAQTGGLDSGARPGLLRPYGEEEIKLQKVYQLSIFSQLGGFTELPEGQRLARPGGKRTHEEWPSDCKRPHLEGDGRAGLGREHKAPSEVEVLCSSGQLFSNVGPHTVGCGDCTSAQDPGCQTADVPFSATLTRHPPLHNHSRPVPSTEAPLSPKLQPQLTARVLDPTPPDLFPRTEPLLVGCALGRTPAEHSEDFSNGEAARLRASERTERALCDPEASRNSEGHAGGEVKGGNGAAAAGTSTPERRYAQAISTNGLASSEKTPSAPLDPVPGPSSSLASPSACPAKRRLLSPCDTGESCSEDEGPSTSKRSRLALLAPGLGLGACRSTDAKGAPFWNHLLPSARERPKGVTDCTRVGRRLKSGLRLKSRQLRSGRRGEACRSGRTGWPSASISHSLLGNFEESILKGRFAPSGRIEGFTAEIGASGSYCPQHATLPVQVTYYDISEHSAPSPFLGVIYLEPLGKKGYSVPKAGTIQVTLFNPNKTVVKMFLVTYNFEDMPVNHVTFLRHRIFLVPVEEGERQGEEPDGGGTDRKKILCYLIHLRFQSSKSGKIYLHNDIRLLFSRKSIEVDTGIPYELKSFTEVPRNPKYSPRV